MRYYVICPVAYMTDEQYEEMKGTVDVLRRTGNKVHFPPDDVDQNCETGITICEAHLKAMKECDAVLLFYAESSGGSKFDLGMAYALGKPVICYRAFETKEGKSYWATFKEYENRYENGTGIKWSL